MGAAGTDLLFRDWYYPYWATGARRIWWEFNDMLTRRASHIRRSRENVIAWREMLRRSGLTFSAHVEGNLFLYRPESPVVARVFPRIFERCYELERDQFIIPFAIHGEARVAVNRWLPQQLNVTRVGHLKKHNEGN